MPEVMPRAVDMTGAAPTAPVEGLKDVVIPEKAEPDKKADSRWSQLARKEKELRSIQSKLQQERESFKTERETAISAGNTEYKTQLRQMFLSDPAKAMEETGLTYDQITQAILNGPNPQDQYLQKLEAKIAELEKGHTKIEEQSKAQIDQQYKDAVKQINYEVKQLVASDLDKYELIQANNCHDDVTALIELTFQKDGRIMSVEEAATDVENYLLEEGVRLTSLKKIQAKIAPKPVAPVAQKQMLRPEVQQRAPAPKTLTHNTIQAGTNKSLGEKARIARAMAAFRGEPLG